VIQKLGIADAVQGQGRHREGRPVGAAIASGEAEIGMQQVAELRPVPASMVIGELPADLQKQIPIPPVSRPRRRNAEPRVRW